MKRSRMAMKFDSYGAMMIQKSWYSYFDCVPCILGWRKHKLPTILIADVVDLARFVSLTFLFKTFFKFFVYFNSLYIL